VSPTALYGACRYVKNGHIHLSECYAPITEKNPELAGRKAQTRGGALSGPCPHGGKILWL
jgi:hypothetical protein